MVSAVGLKISLKCSAQGNPDPTITLHKNGTVLPATSKTTNRLVTATLDISSAKKKDFGLVECVAKNAHGNKTLTLKVIEVGEFDK